MDYIEKIKSNYYPLVVSYGSLIFMGAMLTLLIAVMAPLSEHLHISIASISVLITLQGIGTAISSYIAGFISDKIGRKKVIFAGLLFYIVFLLGMILTTNYLVVSFLSLLSGIGQGLMDPPALSLLIDIFGENSGPAMSMVFVFFSLGGFLASLITNIIIAINLNFIIVFYIFIGLALILFYLILNSDYPDQRENSNIIPEKPIQNNRFYLAITLSIITFFYYSVETIIRTWINIYSNQILQLTLSESVKSLSYFQIGSIVGAFIFAILLTKIHASKLMVINGVITTISLMILLLSNILPMLFIMIIGGSLTVTFSFTLNLAGELYENNPGSGTGIVITASTIASISMAYLTGKGLEIYGVRNIFLLGLGLSIIGTVMSFIYRFFLKLSGKEKSKK